MTAGNLAVPPELEQLVRRALPDARIVGVKRLGNDDGAPAGELTAKGTGYGVPLRIEIERDGRLERLVLHGTSENPFGHDRRADRAAELLLAADTFASIPKHARALDVGAFCQGGSSVSLRDSGEFYLLTEYAEGHPYAEDLRRIAQARRAEPADLDRVRSLASYLAALHRLEPERDQACRRAQRDLLGSGEGIFGIIDGYAGGAPGASSERLQRLEEHCLRWRWRMKSRSARLSRIHGDFHPFNILFDGEGQLRLLDTSRGSLGDPADDVTCLAVNFVFFALGDELAWRSAFEPMWREFWTTYLDQSGDRELLTVAAPYLTWRLLVLACPLWYPNMGVTERDRLLGWAEAALESERFDPLSAEEVFS